MDSSKKDSSSSLKPSLSARLSLLALRRLGRVCAALAARVLRHLYLLQRKDPSRLSERSLREMTLLEDLQVCSSLLSESSLRL